MIHKNAFNLRRSFGGFSKAIEEEMEWKKWTHDVCDGTVKKMKKIMLGKKKKNKIKKDRRLIENRESKKYEEI